jgi:hypothetical protein
MLAPKSLPFRVIPVEPLSEPLPDGDYAFVCFEGYKKKTRYGDFEAINPFPWMASIIRFRDGQCDYPHASSNPGNFLLNHEFKEVLVAEMPEHIMKDLEQLLAAHNVELIAA